MEEQYKAKVFEAQKAKVLSQFDIFLSHLAEFQEKSGSDATVVLASEAVSMQPIANPEVAASSVTDHSKVLAGIGTEHTDSPVSGSVIDAASLRDRFIRDPDAMEKFTPAEMDAVASLYVDQD